MSSLVSATLVLVLAVAGCAWWRGGPPERIAAVIIGGLFVADIAYHLLFGRSEFEAVDPVHLVLDGAEMAAIMGLALRANRMWPLWAAAAGLICYTGHVAAFIEPGGMRRAYWAMTQIPPYIQLLALVIGIAAHARRERRLGPYRSWRLA